MSFGEIAFQPVHSVSISGVTFDFTVAGVPSTDAMYNTPDLGSPMTYLAGSVLEGSAAGTLALSFANPTPFLQFGVALASLNPQLPGVWVRLSGPEWSAPETFSVNTSPLMSFSEAQFTFNGPPITYAVLTFNGSEAGGFALDNLSFDDGTTVENPEPGSVLLVVSGLVMGAFYAGRRGRRPLV